MTETDDLRPGSWNAVRRLLAVRLDNLGDLLMTTPALAAIRHSLPNVHLSVLTSRAAASLAPHVPAIDEVIPFDAPWVRHESDDDGSGRVEAAMLERLVAGRFDAAVIFTVCTQSALPAALFCRQAGIPLRLAHSRENPYRLLTNWVSDCDRPTAGSRHEVQRQVDLVASVGYRALDSRMSFVIGANEAASLRRSLERVGANLEGGYLVVHPGASAPSRRYPPGRFGEAARMIAEASGCRIVVAGAQAERELVEQVRESINGPSTALIGPSLGELGALITSAKLVLCNNSAPAHIAAALERPVVVLYALTNSQHTPWAGPSRVLYRDVPCRDCLKSLCPMGHHQCLLGVSAQQVAQAALSLLDRRLPA